MNTDVFDPISVFICVSLWFIWSFLRSLRLVSPNPAFQFTAKLCETWTTPMRPQEIIATKRDGKALSDEQIVEFVDGVCDGSWADYQITALVMAIYIRGLNRREEYSITGAMLR